MIKNLNFSAVESKAQDMTVDQLRHAIRDIRATLPQADRMDREHGGQCYGGYLRDEASVYHRELRRRGAELEPGR